MKECQGGLACGATCSASSTATADLGCIVAVDGAVLSVSQPTTWEHLFRWLVHDRQPELEKHVFVRYMSHNEF